MMVVLSVLLLASLCELGLGWVGQLWGVRKFLIPAIIAGTAFGSGGLVMDHPSPITFLILLISAYRLFNILRIVEGRMKEAYLRRAIRITSTWLVGLQFVLGGVWWYQERSPLTTMHWFVALVVLQLITAVVLATATARSFRKTSPQTVKATYADRDLPDVTVAIPARNEDQQLEECLHSVLASDYPKLEVIVFDDSSQDRTTQIIRNFAHDGVRFVPGTELKRNWLAKNQAYEQLTHEASGDLIMFCGVDVRFAPQSIRQLVTLLKVKQKHMLSLLPINERPQFSFAQSMRYYWELALPRRLFNRPPVMSSCWLIEAEALKRAGGFAAVSRSITPEALFARNEIKRDGYSFIRSTAHLGVRSAKGISEQRETAIRTRYPQLHRRPELVFLVALAEFLLLFMPYVLTVIGLWGMFGVMPELLLIATCVLLIATYRSITFTTSPVNRWFLSPFFPVTVLADIVLLHHSMYKYEFSTVEWKGRNVSTPVMQVTPHLPKLS